MQSMPAEIRNRRRKSPGWNRAGRRRDGQGRKECGRTVSLKDTSLIVSDETICRTEVRRAVEKWNSLQSVGVEPVIRMQSGSKRYKMLVARIREYGIDAVLKAIDNVKNSKFLTGNVSDFTIDFEWFVKPNNFVKVLENKYKNRDAPEENTAEASRQKFIDKWANV